MCLQWLATNERSFGDEAWDAGGAEGAAVGDALLFNQAATCAALGTMLAIFERAAVSNPPRGGLLLGVAAALSAP